MATIFSLYHIQSAGLNPFQLVVVGAVLEAACFLTEIPTGVVADMYSRKLSLVLGLVIMGVGIAIEGSFASFIPILFAQVIWGMGATFLSGADVAWLSDEIGTENVAPVLLRGGQVYQLASIAGIVVSVVLANQSLHLPVVASGVGLILLGLLMVGIMRETHKPASQTHGPIWQAYGQQVKRGAHFLFRQSALLPLVIVVWLGGLYNEGIDRLWVYRITEDLGLPAFLGQSPLYWFAAIQIVLLLLNFMVLRMLESRLGQWSERRQYTVLILNNLILGLALATFALAGGLALALGAYWLLMVSRASGDPIATILVNNRIQDSNIRATVHSMKGLADQCGQILGGLCIGVIALYFSVQAGLLLSGIVILPIIALLLKCRHKSRATL